MATRADQRAAGPDLEDALARLEDPVRPPLVLAPPLPADPETAPAAASEPVALAPADPPTAPAPVQAAPRPVPARPAPASVRPLATTPPSLRVGRFQLLARQKERLLGRQGAWIAWSALAGAILAATGLASAWPLPTLLASLALGAWAAFPRQLLRAPAVALAAVSVGVLVAGIQARDPLTLVAGPEVLAAGAVLGVGLTWLDGEAVDRWRRLNGALGGAATAGLGWWAATHLVGPLATSSAVDGALHGAVLGLVASQALVPAALAWIERDRLPTPARIRSSLAASYREPCLRAWQLDQGFAAQAPDEETRDGLGEVAAWVYRLQWTLQALDQELATLDDVALVERRVELTARAAESSDDFTRDRLEATARHLAQLGAHRRELARERDRSAALSEYASAYLEEARAGLALAQVQPGDHTPGRLDDVLGRLRSHAAEQDARRRTAREVGPLA